MLEIHAPLPVPRDTAHVCRAALPHGNRYLTLRDNLGTIFNNEMFTHLFSTRGRPAEVPWRLALVTVVQFAENLSDRKAAEAVRTRLDLKYLLGLELDDPGFHFSVLSRSRNRLIKGNAEHLLLDALIELCKTEGMVKGGGTARTDSTHVLANARDLSLLELVGEMLRHALNDISKVSPDWLRDIVLDKWYERYVRRFEEDYHKLIKRNGLELITQIGRDGFLLLQAVYDETASKHLADLTAVETLRRCWLQHFYVQDDEVKRRESGNLPVSTQRIDSPFETEARYAKKGGLSWLGYKVHLTETCDDTSPHLVTHVTTTPAPVHDVTHTPIIQNALEDKNLLPAEHLVDSIYTSADLVLKCRRAGTQLTGPMQTNSHWQQREGGYDILTFQIDWEHEVVTCPEGKQSSRWSNIKDRSGKDLTKVGFSRVDCRPCLNSHLCVRQAGQEARTLTLRSREQHELLQEARAKQKTPEWLARYRKRGGIEGTISQGVHTAGMRRSRYRGLRKCHLQSLAVATAINVQRLTNWLCGVPRSATRRSRFLTLRP